METIIKNDIGTISIEKDNTVYRVLYKYGHTGTFKVIGLTDNKDKIVVAQRIIEYAYDHLKQDRKTSNEIETALYLAYRLMQRERQRNE